jgi:RNA-binding protein YlmH
MNQHLWMHFRKEEHAFVERSLDWIYRAGEQYRVVLTGFLDPREQAIVQMLLQAEYPTLQLKKDGGYTAAERCRIWLAPEYAKPDQDSFSLLFVSLESDGELAHRDVLGSLLGLGIKRSFIGDILPKPTGADVILAAEMRDYVWSSLTKVGRKAIIISEITSDQLSIEQEMGVKQQTTVSSLRLDTVIAAMCRLSRAKSADLIRLGRCKVNWQVIDQTDYQLEAGDVLSVRGYGRMRLEAVHGTTKKGRFPISYVRKQ